MTLIALSDAKRRLKLGQPIHVLSDDGLDRKFAESMSDLKAGNVFIEEEIKYPNDLELSDLSVKKYSDGTAGFYVNGGYDSYSASINSNEIETLVKFLTEPYESEEG